mmetsp:Transcript_36432/g.85609  ORF Transcript_36432/g.85609 Transcript_36432/m.85609 type:complete len:211 (+) Transcript_36432:635-1267(+)
MQLSFCLSCLSRCLPGAFGLGQAHAQLLLLLLLPCLLHHKCHHRFVRVCPHPTDAVNVLEQALLLCNLLVQCALQILHLLFVCCRNRLFDLGVLNLFLLLLHLQLLCMFLFRRHLLQLQVQLGSLPLEFCQSGTKLVPMRGLVNLLQRLPELDWLRHLFQQHRAGKRLGASAQLEERQLATQGDQQQHDAERLRCWRVQLQQRHRASRCG